MIKASHTLHQCSCKISQCCLQTVQIFPTLTQVTLEQVALVLIILALRAMLTEHFTNSPQYLQA
jgi:hypothetical protein